MRVPCRSRVCCCDRLLVRPLCNVHNIVFATTDYDATVAAMQGCGIGSHIGGTWFGTRFMNFASRPALPVIAEIYDTAEGASFPPPEATYPSTH